MFQYCFINVSDTFYWCFRNVSVIQSSSWMPCSSDPQNLIELVKVADATGASENNLIQKVHILCVYLDINITKAEASRQKDEVRKWNQSSVVVWMWCFPAIRKVLINIVEGFLLQLSHKQAVVVHRCSQHAVILSCVGACSLLCGTTPTAEGPPKGHPGFKHATHHTVSWSSTASCNLQL